MRRTGVGRSPIVPGEGSQRGAAAVKYRGFVQGAYVIFTEEGLRGLYKGCAHPPAAPTCPLTADAQTERLPHARGELQHHPDGRCASSAPLRPAHAAGPALATTPHLTSHFYTLDVCAVLTVACVAQGMTW